jgi:protein disulfide-isomerase A6
MLQSTSALLLAASLLAALPVNADGLYTNKSPVLQVDQKGYNKLIANSNYSSVSTYIQAPSISKPELTTLS